MRFTYCPACGTSLSSRILGDEGAIPWCDHCVRPWFDMFSTCVIAAVVNEQGEVSLLREARDPSREVLVAGYIKPGESAENAVRREIQEELGLHAESLHLLGTTYHPKADQLMVAFVVSVRKAPLILSYETQSAAWVKLENAEQRVPPGSIALQVVQSARALFQEVIH